MASKEHQEPAPAPAKRKRLSLKLKDKERFPLLPKNQIEDSKQAIIPKNTQKSTQWALRCFGSWLKQRNERCEDKCPEGILLSDNHQDLCHWLCVCINELRKETGDEYTPRSLAQFIAGLQRYISEKKQTPVRLADPGNPDFKPLHLTLDNRYRELHAKGVGTTRRQAEIMTSDEEEQLWASGVLSSDSPGGLLRAVFYYNGLNFVLRGGQEHRNLKISQLNLRTLPDPENPGDQIDCVEYSEHKNRPGGRHQLNLHNKTVVQYARPELGERCHVYLLQLYLSKLP